jgi:hypothetical protein
MEYNAPPPESAPVSVPNSTMAIVSLIAGVLGLTFLPTIGSIVAVITGTMARKEIRESAGAIGGDGMAVAGLVLGWIGVGLLVIGLCIGCALAAFAVLVSIGVLSNQNSLLLPAILAAM